MEAALSPIEKVFEDKYTQKLWPGGLGDGTKSGFGSTLQSTEIIRGFIPGLITTLGINSMLDAPCGDFHWMRHVKLPENFRYIGGDIVQLVIDELVAKESAPGFEFRYFDIIKSEFPEADAWLCRDCLIHLPLENAVEALQNFANSKAKYALITHQEDEDENRDINPGQFSRRNLLAAPFNFPQPIEYSIDGPFVDNNPSRKLGVWTREQVAKALKG